MELKAKIIHADEVALIKSKIADPNESNDQKEYWKEDLKDLTTDPIKYWERFWLPDNEPDNERHEEIKFMQNFYKHQNTFQNT